MAIAPDETFSMISLLIGLSSQITKLRSPLFHLTIPKTGKGLPKTEPNVENWMKHFFFIIFTEKFLDYKFIIY